ncbi:hypothetical protein [Fructilactobacillus sanfranciscensis]|uniref:hypothetical protein n=1 Tax=Fructilactobacillus sanfranciscensis TaxID=1625 RepID=UPI001EE21631|nr:hypothetical protein [Fructilactobacillus sanfranciscensis]
MKISLVNPVTNQIKRAKIGFSWTTFLFGFWPALFRGDWLWFIIMFVTETMLGYRTYAFGSLIVGIVFAFIYNKLYINGLLNKGWVAADAYSNNNPAQTQSSPVNDDNYQSTSTSTDNQSDDSNSSLDNEDNKVKNQVNSVTDKTDNKSKQDSNSNPSTTTSNANNNSSKNDNNQSNPTNN